MQLYHSPSAVLHSAREPRVEVPHRLHERARRIESEEVAGVFHDADARARNGVMIGLTLGIV